jgi:hypothetical protein
LHTCAEVSQSPRGDDEPRRHRETGAGQSGNACSLAADITNIQRRSIREVNDLSNHDPVPPTADR